jgi:hypothetical protein
MALPTSEPPLNTAKAYPDPDLKPPALSVPTTAPEKSDSLDPASNPPVKKFPPGSHDSGPASQHHVHAIRL